MKDSLRKLEQLHRAVLDALLLGLEVNPSEADYFRSLRQAPDTPRVDHRLSGDHVVSLAHRLYDLHISHPGSESGTGGRRLKPAQDVPSSPTTEIEDRIWFTMGSFGEIWSNGYLPASKHRVMILAHHQA
ncbi:hypothetical protein AtubIFM57258_009608 [Aspergillus tubingensis]|nr:hypothetical protein AtubIFM57258_009608 [Aspergillus tubingensis]